MLTCARHSRSIYASLPEVLDASRQFTFTERAIVDELGGAALQAGVTNEFGACMLHRHFDVDDKEMLVERLTGDAATPIRTTPEPATARLMSQVAPTVLMLNGSDGWTALEYAPLQPGHSASLAPREHVFLIEAERILRMRGVSTRIGLFRAYHAIGLRSDASLVENAYEDSRELLFELVTDLTNLGTVVETRWMWEAETTPALGCHTDYRTVCRSGCRSFTVQRCNSYADRPGHHSTPVPQHDRTHTSHTETSHHPVH
jgi:hypothetical protein